MDKEIYIKTKSDAMENIGKVVYWDDISVRYHFLRSGIMQGFYKGHFLIDGDYKSKGSVPGLRNFKGKRWE